MDNETKCPFSGSAHQGRSNRDWWPNQLNLTALHTNPPAGDPMDAAFNYAEEFKKLDLDRVRKELTHPIIFDGRNLFDPQEMERLGFIYKSIGR